MNDVTEKIRQALNQELIAEPTDSRYQAYNTGGVEVETGELLYGLVRFLKPKHILETGTFLGISSSYIGLALKKNSELGVIGLLETIEYEKKHYDKSIKLFQSLELDSYIKSYQMLVENFNPKDQYELMFLDTEVSLRLHELVRFFPNLVHGGYVFIHDMPYSLCQGNVNPDHPEFKHWPLGEIPPEVTSWVKNGDLRPMFFPNPRGMMGLYKPRSDEHKWI